MPQQATLLEVSHLRVEFPTRRGTLVAVDDVSFDIRRGEVLGVVGESGAGKSLTGMAIIGLLERPGRIAAGEIRLDGERIDHLPAAAMRRIRGRRIAIAIDEEDQAQSAGEEAARRGRAHACLLTFDVSDLAAIKPLAQFQGSLETFQSLRTVAEGTMRTARVVEHRGKVGGVAQLVQDCERVREVPQALTVATFAFQ